MLTNIAIDDKQNVLNEIKTTMQPSFSFIHPVQGKSVVTIDRYGRFLHNATRLTTESITYFGLYNGDFTINTGCVLNARISRDGGFEIRSSSPEFTHFGYSNVLEIIQPRMMIDFIALEGNSMFKITSVNCRQLHDTNLALSLAIDDSLLASIKDLELKQLENKIEIAYESLGKKRSTLHLGLINIRGLIPILYYIPIKCKMVKIVKESEIINHSFNEFSVGAYSDTILMKPSFPKSETYREVNRMLRICLNYFNEQFEIDPPIYPDIFTGDNYDPHITLVNADVVKKLVEAPNAFAENPDVIASVIDKIFREIPIIKFRDSNYQLPSFKETTSKLLRDLSSRLTANEGKFKVMPGRKALFNNP